MRWGLGNSGEWRLLICTACARWREAINPFNAYPDQCPECGGMIWHTWVSKEEARERVAWRN